MRRLHELATSKCGNIFSSKLKPLTVLSTLEKALMPVPLDSDRIISLDRMHCYNSLGKLDG
jgi:hypothetical protein